MRQACPLSTTNRQLPTPYSVRRTLTRFYASFVHAVAHPYPCPPRSLPLRPPLPFAYPSREGGQWATAPGEARIESDHWSCVKMSAPPAFKRLVIDLRYRPTLRVYAHMDSIGVHFAKDFPDWERSALALEIRNRKTHRRLIVTHRQTVYDSLSPTADTAEFELVKEAVNLTCKRLDFQQFERFAICAWFVTASKQQLGDLANESARSSIAHSRKRAFPRPIARRM